MDNQKKLDELVKDLSVIKFDLNDGVSDVICRLSEKFINEMTGESGDELDAVVRPGKRFFVYNKTFNKTLYGFRLFWEKELDVLVFICARLVTFNGKKIWMEAERSFLHREYGSYGKFPHKGALHDICGQTVSKNLMSCMNYQVEPVGAKKEALSYFGGFVLLRPKNDFPHSELLTLDTVTGIETLFLRFQQESFPMYDVPMVRLYDGLCLMASGKKGNKTGEIQYMKHCDDTLPCIPEEAENKLRYHFMKIVNDSCARGSYDNIHEAKHELAVLQNHDGAMYLRKFRPFIFYGNTESEHQMSLIESYRTKIDKDSFAKPSCSYMVMARIVWRDLNIKDTVFEHTINIIDDQIAWFEAKLDSDNNNFGLLDSRFYKEYGIGTDLCCYAAILASKNYVLEAASKLKYENMKSLREQVFNKVFYGESLESLFGVMDISKTKFHEILMIPKEVLKTLIEENCVDKIKEIKQLFGNDISILQNLNEHDLDVLVRFMKKTSCTRIYMPCITKMIGIWGIKNWRAYAEHLLTFPNYGFYEEYIERLESIGGDIAKNAQWKLSGNELHKAYDSLEEAYLVSLNRGDFKDVARKYEELAKTWEKYSYSHGGFVITYPKHPSDLVKEGLKLNHCAKQFISAVANRQTTILFIRKEGEEYDPFFTLEIQNNIVRQCHGKNNRNISTEESMEDFLRKFCLEKKIVFSEGYAELAV